MNILYEVNEIPQENHRKYGRRNSNVMYAINVFIESGMKYALVNENAFPHANGNNLRRNFVSVIKAHNLNHMVAATIRGNDVYLIRKGE